MGRGDELHWYSDDGLEGPKGEGSKGQSMKAVFPSWGLPRVIQMKCRHGRCPVAWIREIVVHLHKLTDMEMRLWISHICPERQGLRHVARDEEIDTY